MKSLCTRFVFIFSTLVGILLIGFQNSAIAKTAPPNIIVILADDVSPDKFSVFQQLAAVNTPNIDKLAAKGVAFKTAYATAMCGPSRVQIMTGKYANSTGVYHNSLWLGNSHDDVYSKHDNFAKALKDNGYHTAIVGKWHAGKQMPHEKELAFDEYALWVNDKYAKELGDNKAFNGAYEDHKTPSRYWQPSYSINGARLQTQPTDFSLDIETKFINDYMAKQVKKAQPFLVYWPTVAPHGTRKGMPTTPFRGKIGEMGKTTKKETWQRFDALIEYLDYSVGKVITQVEKLGISDNTVIIFASDNGTAVTAKTRGVERGPHVVTIFSGSTVKARGLSDALVDFTDIAPTLVDLAGAKKDYDFDGKSLAPYLSGETDVHREWIYGYISGSQIFRTKDFLLEVVNPMLGLPDGRLYFTGKHRFQKGYQRIKPEQAQYQEAMAFFAPIRKTFPALELSNGALKTKKIKAFIAEYSTDKNKVKHLYNHKNYQFYDESD